MTEKGLNTENLPLKLTSCNGSSRQKWDGFNWSKEFEIHPADNSNFCVTQMHHPKAHEKVFPQKCGKPRDHDTSNWIVY